MSSMFCDLIKLHAIMVTFPIGLPGTWISRTVYIFSIYDTYQLFPVPDITFRIFWVGGLFRPGLYCEWKGPSRFPQCTPRKFVAIAKMPLNFAPIPTSPLQRIRKLHFAVIMRDSHSQSPTRFDSHSQLDNSSLLAFSKCVMEPFRLLSFVRNSVHIFFA